MAGRARVIWWRRCAARAGPTNRFAHGGPRQGYLVALPRGVSITPAKGLP
jgi:hypothetical protein